MVWLLQNCQLVMTDSGGLQKEAYFFNKQCITLREETEWVELVENGYNVISGSSKSKIIDNFNRIANNSDKDFDIKLYGDGNTAAKIIEALINF